MGVRHALFPGPAFGAHAGLLVSRRHSPRQAEFPASWQGRPRFCNRWILSEAFQLASAGGCATGLPTRSRHACIYIPRLNHLVSGLPPLLAVRSPGTTGLASSLSSCVSLTVRRCLFLTSPAVGSFSRNLPNLVVFPTRPLFLSAFRRFSQGGFPY